MVRRDTDEGLGGEQKADLRRWMKGWSPMPQGDVTPGWSLILSGARTEDLRVRTGGPRWLSTIVDGKWIRRTGQNSARWHSGEDVLMEPVNVLESMLSLLNAEELLEDFKVGGAWFDLIWSQRSFGFFGENGLERNYENGFWMKNGTSGDGSSLDLELPPLTPWVMECDHMKPMSFFFTLALSCSMEDVAFTRLGTLAFMGTFHPHSSAPRWASSYPP